MQHSVSLIPKYEQFFIYHAYFASFLISLFAVNQLSDDEQVHKMAHIEVEWKQQF